MREFILSEIRRLASESAGQPPGSQLFSKATGISEGKWRGIYWARWGDALKEAGFAPNLRSGRADTIAILDAVLALCVELGKIPTTAEMKLKRRADGLFPHPAIILRHFEARGDFLAALRKRASEKDLNDIVQLIPASIGVSKPKGVSGGDGSVYLLKSGRYYKIGQSGNVERRYREITVALPEPMRPIHEIKTDDPSGIENYWHRRFADRRVRPDAEWFDLRPEDVRAFCRRTFQ